MFFYAQNKFSNILVVTSGATVKLVTPWRNNIQPVNLVKQQRNNFQLYLNRRGEEENSLKCLIYNSRPLVLPLALQFACPTQLLWTQTMSLWHLVAHSEELMSNLSYVCFGEESVLNFHPIYTIQYKLVKSMVYCGLRTSGVLFPGHSWCFL